MIIDNKTIQKADDYLTQEIYLCYDSHAPMVLVIQTMDKHPFVQWIDRQPYFKKAKGKMTKSCALIEDTHNSRANEFRKHFALEGLVAFTIMSTKKVEKDLLNQVVVRKTEHKSMIALLEKVHARLTEGKMYFGNGVKQQIITVLIDDALRNPGYNLFSSKKDHESLLRHTFIAHFMQGLARIYTNVTDTLLVDVTLEIVDGLFNPMGRGELEKLIKTIRSVVDDENKLLEKTVYEIYMKGLD